MENDMQYDNSNRGALWKNDRRDKETHPQLKGSTNVVCPHCNKATDYWTSAWTSSEGGKKPLVSISLQAKDGVVNVPAPKSPDVVETFEDDIPW
jgi:hypothetical protein